MKVSQEQWPPPTVREDVWGYSPLQHALGKEPDLDGRFYIPENETLPSVQAELVDETYGNNIKQMQDSEVIFLRWTYQNRVSRVLNSKNRKHMCFARNECLPLTQRQKSERDKKDPPKALLEFSAPNTGEATR